MKHTIKLKIILILVIIISSFVGSNLYSAYVNNKADLGISKGERINQATLNLTLAVTNFYLITQEYFLIKEKSEIEMYKSRWFRSLVQINPPLNKLEEYGIEAYTLTSIHDLIQKMNVAANDLINSKTLMMITSDPERLKELEDRIKLNFIVLSNSKIKLDEAINEITVVAHNNYADLLKEKKKAGFISILFNLLSIILATFISVYIANSITRPVRELVKATEQMSNGDLNITLNINTKDEIQDLSISFNKMAEDLKKSTINIKDLKKEIKKRHGELQDINKLLDKQVKEKTKELQKAKDELEEKVLERTNDLKAATDELKKSQKELEQKNKELEETLEDFYTLRIGMQKDLELGRVEEENKKMKKRLDDLKKKK